MIYSDTKGAPLTASEANANMRELSNRSKQCIAIACSNETAALTAGTAKVTMRMPYDFVLLYVKASLTTPQASGSALTIDVNQNGASILSTRITIDNGEKTSATAQVSPIVSNAFLADDAEITVDIDQLGDGSAKGLKVYLIGLSQSSLPSGDPHWATVASMIQFDGGNNSTAIVDERGLTWVALGNAKLSTAQKKFGSAALYLNGGSGAIRTGANDNLNFGTGNFTIEMWIYQVAITNPNAAIISSGGGTWASGEVRLAFYNSDGRVAIQSSDGAINIPTAGELPIGAWSHVALTRSGNDLRIFINGVEGAIVTTSVAMNFNASGGTFIGYSDVTQQSVNAYIDGLRISKGIARYTADFTPPAAPFPVGWGL